MRRGFTLVELLVTIVIVGLVLGLAVPRVSTLTGRGVSAEADGVAGLLSSAAGRSAVGSQPLRLRVEANTVEVERRELERSGGRELWVWRRDPFMPRVGLSRGAVSGVFVDGVAIAGPPWTVELGGDRSVEIVLAGGEAPVGVTLMAGALRAVVVEGERLIEPPGRIDLDASGMGSSPW